MTKNDKKRKKMKSSRPEGPKAGPQGRQLEVGPRRGPRLLVNNNTLTPAFSAQKLTPKNKPKEDVLHQKNIKKNTLILEFLTPCRKSLHLHRMWCM